MRISIREVLLITTVVALTIPYVVRATANAIPPSFDIHTSEVLEWIQRDYNNAVVRSRMEGSPNHARYRQFIIEANADPKSLMQSISTGIQEKLKSEGWHSPSAEGRSDSQRPSLLFFQMEKRWSRQSLCIMMLDSSELQQDIVNGTYPPTSQKIFSIMTCVAK